MQHMCVRAGMMCVLVTDMVSWARAQQVQGEGSCSSCSRALTISSRQARASRAREAAWTCNRERAHAQACERSLLLSAVVPLWSSAACAALGKSLSNTGSARESYGGWLV
jgi:hypothetical protein